MKLLRNTLSFILPVFLFISSGYAQPNKATKETQEVVVGVIIETGDTILVFGEGIRVTTPSNNFLKTHHFKVPEEIMEQVDFGYFANRIVGIRLKLQNGEELIGVGFLNKAGVLNFTIHKNGAGTYFPKGWS